MRELTNAEVQEIVSALVAGPLGGLSPESVAVTSQWWTGSEDTVTMSLVLSLRHTGTFRGAPETWYLAEGVPVLAVAQLGVERIQVVDAAFDGSALLTAFGMPHHARPLRPAATLSPRTVGMGSQVSVELDAYGLSPTAQFEFRLAGHAEPDSSIQHTVSVRDGFFADFTIQVGNVPGPRDLVMRDRITVDGQTEDVEATFPYCLLVVGA